MRYVAGIFVADNPAVWRWAVGAVQEHVLAAEDHVMGRWGKALLFLVLRCPAWRRLLPVRPLSTVALLAGEDDGGVDLAFRRSHGKWISFRIGEGVLSRHFPSRWRWQKERWIRQVPAVAATAPKVLGWDEERLTCEEEYIPGRPVRVHDLHEGLTAWKAVWPLLGEVYQTRTATRPLQLPAWADKNLNGHLIERTGLRTILEELVEVPVQHGLVHGDLQHSNMLVHDGRFYVIDWGDHFRLAPPLYDLLFYLFKHSRSVGVERVMKAALDDPAWIEEGIPGALEPLAVKASIVAFSLMLGRRYQFRKVRRRRQLLRQLQAFIRGASSRLLPSSAGLVQLPEVLLHLPDSRVG